MNRPKPEIIDALSMAEKTAMANIKRGDDFERSAYCLFYVYAAVGNIDRAAEYLQRCVDFRLPIKKWRTLERVNDNNVRDNDLLRAIVESSHF